MKKFVFAAMLIMLLSASFANAQVYVISDIFVEKDVLGKDTYYAELRLVNNPLMYEVDSLEYLTYIEDYFVLDYLPIVEIGDTVIAGWDFFSILPKDEVPREKEVKILNSRGKVKYTRLYEFKNGEIKITTKRKNKIKENCILCFDQQSF